MTFYFFAYFAMAAFTCVLPVYLTDIGKTAGEMSFIVSASSCFSLALGPLIGYLCDRTQRPRLISCLLMAGMGGSAMAFAFFRETWALFLLQGAAMSFFGAAQPVSEQLAANAPYRYGVLRIWGTFGYALGAQAAGLTIQIFPGPVLFSVAALTSALAAAGVAAMGGQGMPGGQRERTAGEKRLPLAFFLHNPAFLLYILISFLVMGCSGVNNTYLPLLLQDFGVSMGKVGTVLSVGTLVEVPVILFSNKFMDRFSSKTLLMTITGIFTLQYLLYAVASGPWGVIIPLILLKAIATTLLMMLNLKVVRNLVMSNLVTVALSIVNACNGLGSIFLQNAGGAFADRFPLQTLYTALTGLALLTLLLSLFLRVEDREKVFA